MSMQRSDIPKNAVTFDATDFGGYRRGVHGFDRSLVAGRMTGIPIRNLLEGLWLCQPSAGGTSLTLRDADGVVLGTIYVGEMGAGPFRPFAQVSKPK